MQNNLSTNLDYFSFFSKALNNSLNKDNLKLIDSIIKETYCCLKNNNKLLFAGNGGSASDCQHFSAEYVSKILRKRKALNSISLTSDISAITSIANDFGFEFIFSRQLEAIGKKNDLLFLYSTSGNSKNILNAIKTANEMGIKTIGFTGKNKKNFFSNNCNIVLNISSNKTSHIQEIYKLISHYICLEVEKFYL